MLYPSWSQYKIIWWPRYSNCVVVIRMVQGHEGLYLRYNLHCNCDVINETIVMESSTRVPQVLTFAVVLQSVPQIICVKPKN